MNEIIRFTDILKNNIGHRAAKGEEITGDELQILDDNILDDTKAIESFSQILLSIHNWCKRYNTNDFVSLIIDKYYVPVLTSEVIDYKKIMSELSFKEDTWDRLFLTVCGVWLKITEDLTLDPNFDRVKNLRTKEGIESTIKDSSYIAYTSTIVAYSYLVGQHYYEESLPELCDPEEANLSIEDSEMMLPFILITLAILTAEFTKLNVIDHNLINEWCTRTGLTSESQHADIMYAAKNFFGKRIKDRDR